MPRLQGNALGSSLIVVSFNTSSLEFETTMDMSSLTFISAVSVASEPDKLLPLLILHLPLKTHPQH